METKYTDNSLGGTPPSENAQTSRLNELVNGREEPAAALKVEHSIVLRTLKAANIASRRVVNNHEIVRALSDTEATQIKSAYHQNIGTVVGKILTLLQARGLVFSPGKIGGNRFYGATAVFPSGDATLPNKQTRRGRILFLVRGAVEHFKRAVRIGDVLDYANRRPETCDLDTPTIVHDVLSLAQTGELRIVGIVRGEGNGNNLYLPSELEPALYMPVEPLTWLEEVARAFNEVWAEHLKKAGAENRLPRPVSTGEVRVRWAASPDAHQKARERQPVVNAMGMLAKNSRKQPPLVRKIRRKGEKAILWVPVDTPDERVDVGYAHVSDAERVGAAVKRAVEHLGRPVSVRDVADEVDLDPTLKPASSLSLHKLLTDASRELITVGRGKRQERRIRRVHRVGEVGNVTYYYHSADGLEEAHAYVELQRVETRWLATQAEERLGRIKDCLAPSLAIGGARLVAVEAQNYCHALGDLLALKMDGITRRETEDLLERIKMAADEARACITAYSDEILSELPEDVSTDVPGWTAEELFSVLYPIHPILKNDKDHNDLNALLCKRIRRVPNPDFRHRFSKEPRGASEFLFDRADALMYAARRWGGYECSFQAKIASGELGWLRDVRYVFPALRARDIRIRLSGVACLAFLWSEEGNDYLRQTAVADSEPGVRQSALWAYGFAGGKDVHKLLRELCRNDVNANVRSLAKKAMNLNATEWWVV
jgi:hypothetical protein